MNIYSGEEYFYDPKTGQVFVSTYERILRAAEDTVDPEFKED